MAKLQVNSSYLSRFMAASAANGDVSFPQQAPSAGTLEGAEKVTMAPGETAYITRQGEVLDDKQGVYLPNFWSDYGKLHALTPTFLAPEWLNPLLGAPLHADKFGAGGDPDGTNFGFSKTSQPGIYNVTCDVGENDAQWGTWSAQASLVADFRTKSISDVKVWDQQVQF